MQKVVEQVEEKVESLISRVKGTVVQKHSTYEHVDDEKDADAVAWTFLNHHKMKKYPYKFPPLKPDECRVQVLYSGLCHTDCSFAQEHWFPTGQYPFAPGHEVVGIVTHVGSEVKDLKVGDRVGYGGKRQSCEKCEFCLKGANNLCQGEVDQKESYGEKYWGGYNTHIQHPAQWLFKIPESLPSDKVAPLMCAAVTCYAPIARMVKPGDKVAVLGMGGLGHMGVKIAKAWGCNVTAFTSNEDKVDIVQDLCKPDRVVHITDESLKEEKNKFDFVLNTITISYDGFDRLLELTKPLGTFSQVGLPAKSNKTSIWAGTLIFYQINFAGSMYGSRDEVRNCLDFCAQHNILPDCEFYDFNDFPKAYERVLKENPIFRCVVNCKDYAFKSQSDESLSTASTTSRTTTETKTKTEQEPSNVGV